MPFPRWLIAAALSLVMAAGSTPASAVSAHDPDAGMCQMNTERGAIPSGFVVAACVDGAAIWLRNDLSLVVPFRATGDVGAGDRRFSDVGLAAIATHLVYSDPLILLPGDYVRLPIGSGAASVKVATDRASEDAPGFHLIAVALEEFFPLPKLQRYKDGYDIFVRLVKAVILALQNYRTCLVGLEWLEQMGCHTDLVGAILAAVSWEGLLLIVGSVNPLVAKLLDKVTFTQFLLAMPANAERIVSAPGSLVQAAVGGASALPSTGTTTPAATAGPALAPAPPSNVTATGIAPDTVRVQWTDNSANESSFAIEAGGVTKSAGANATRYDWKGLAPGSQLCVRVRAVNSVGASAFAPASAVCATVPTISTPQRPSFIYPVNGQTLDLEGAYLFKVTAVPNASGYLFGFFQDGNMVWENYRDEGTLSGTEYGIQEGSEGHSRFHAGQVEVWVRALVFGQWTDERVITISLQPR